MSTTRARMVVKRCPMFDPACAAKVVEHVTAKFVAAGVEPPDVAAQLEAACGRYSRGAHKGQLRGWAAIETCVSGGWRANDNGSGGVVYPGTIGQIVVEAFDGKTLFSAW